MTFYPEPLPLANELCTPHFIAKPLAPEYVAQDYDAYINSPDVIRVHSGGRWQTDGFTQAEDLALIHQHQARHQARQDFAFILLDKFGTQGLGCFYLLPLQAFLQRMAAEARWQTAYDAQAVMVTFWLRQGALVQAPEVIRHIYDWLMTAWQFSAIVFRVNHEELASIDGLYEAHFERKFSLNVPHAPHLYYFYAPKATTNAMA